MACGKTNGELCIWGTTHNIPTFCFVLEVVEPGLMVIKHHRGEQSGKYVNVAVLEGDQVKIVDENASSLPDCPELVTSLLGFDSPASWVDSVNVLVQLAVAMRATAAAARCSSFRRAATPGANRLCIPSRTPSLRRFGS